ncbi:hypothetical protein NC653_019575 [Populus alba x Populus x berolinensis]|uniref:Uncharacterized protein n=1 Tax=Populus alba x Populus x berolinensis TaxID=444605 RepID=A0AAD6VXV4_9ROSI|nr:hypothetical protein NC653_019575 [Populus alba x Populus x berolinensis]
MAIDLDAAKNDGFLSPLIGNLMELTSLGIRKNNFRGPIPENIANLQKFNRLLSSQNLFTGRMPHSKHLEILDLQHSGPLWLWQLNTLDLSGNNLKGIVPHLPINLRRLSMSYNVLSGHISPSSVFKHLTVLDLSDHRLSSPIPQEIPTLPLVVRLNIPTNKFTEMEFSARIPVEYGPKPGSSWKILFLEDNFLTENPPPQFIDRTVAVCNSLARNCSRCPLNIRFCRGQRPG